MLIMKLMIQLKIDDTDTEIIIYTDLKNITKIVISNMYYHSNKAWIPEKNTEKLEKVISQTEEKKYFLESVFDLYL